MREAAADAKRQQPQPQIGTRRATGRVDSTGIDDTFEEDRRKLGEKYVKLGGVHRLAFG